MSIQRTAESALYSLEELYKAIDLSSQQQSAMSGNDSENLVQALCNLSQLINQTGMCDRTPIMTTNFDAKRFNRKKMKNFISQHLNDDDEHRYMDSATIGSPSPPQSRQPYGECVLYHPIRIITTSADGPIMLHESDSVRKEEQYRKDHGHSQQFPHHRHTKKNGRRMSRIHDHRLKTSRSGSRGSRISRRSRRSSRGRGRQSRGRRSRSSRRLRSRSSRSSKSGYRRSNSRGRRSRRSRSSQRRSRSRRRSSQKRRSTDRQYHNRQIPSRPISTTKNPTAPLYPSNQMGSTSTGVQQPYIRSQPSPAPITTTSNGSILPPPPISTLQHHPHPSSILHGNNTPAYRSAINPLNDQSSSYQQVPVVTQQQQPTSLSSTNPLLNTSTQNGVLSSSISPLQTTNSTLTSRSDNCPECRAITRLLQWAPLKCYDAAGIRRGVFLAGPKSEQLLKALYSSIKDSSLSLDDIEDCLCDNE